MRIGIDISQTVYEGTGVSGYLTSLVNALIKIDRENEYVLFFSSLRRKIHNSKFKIHNSRVKVKMFRLPPILLDLLWNRLHVLPIEWLIGDVDIFITSDWTEPPTIKARKATIIYDLIVYLPQKTSSAYLPQKTSSAYKYPNETHQGIVDTQKRKLKWVKKESNVVFCISEATKRDAVEILGIPENKLKVIYPGI